MGTVLNVTLPDTSVNLADSVYQIFKVIDSLMNPIKETSDLHRINEFKSAVVHPYTADCIRKALYVSEITGGAFDITVGSLVHLWHFDEYGKYVLPPVDSIEKYRKYVDFRKIVIKEDGVEIGKNQRITLAGIAKGYAIDLAVECLKSKGITSAIIDAGGDLYLLGKKGGKNYWQVGIRDPHSKGVNRVILLKDVACCTSGDYERFVEQNGKRYSHIFSPFDGYPVSNGVRSVTVIFDNATLCDAFATAIFVLGPEEAKLLREKVKGLEYYIIMDDTTIFSEGFQKFFLNP